MPNKNLNEDNFQELTLAKEERGQCQRVRLWDTEATARASGSSSLHCHQCVPQCGCEESDLSPVGWYLSYAIITPH